MSNPGQLKLHVNPFSPSVETFESLTITFLAPNEKAGVRILVQPNITNYKDEISDSNSRIRQLTENTHTPDTQELEFNLNDKNEHKISSGGLSYSMTLQHIGDEEVAKAPGQKFLYYEFLICRE
jgi:hypothetical protein